MTQPSATTLPSGDPRPVWLRDAPHELKPILQIGFEKFGDDPPSIAAWLESVRDYRQFWQMVAAEPTDLEQRYARDTELQARIADDRAHPERRLPRARAGLREGRVRPSGG